MNMPASLSPFRLTWPTASRSGPATATWGWVSTRGELAPSIPVLADEAANGVFDAVLHAGDYA